MNIEFLDTIGYSGGIEKNAYLINMEDNIEKIYESGKKIVLFGAGEISYIAETLLRNCGIKIYGYADNSKKLIGKKLRGGVIDNPKELFKDKDVYFIITTPEKYISEIRLQFLVEGIENYSIFAPILGNNFKYVDEGLHNAYMNASNLICFDDEKPDTAMPHCPYASSREGQALVPISNVMWVTMWSHHAYLWIDKYLNKPEPISILEIGPGDGMLSCVMLSRHNNLDVTWLIYGDEKQSQKEGFDKHLSKVEKKYRGRVSIRYGMIEIMQSISVEKYDLIVLTEVFEHFALNPVNTLLKIKEVISGEGRIVITTPNWGHRGPYKTWKDIPGIDDLESIEKYHELTNIGHVYQYDKTELDEIFALAGLEVEKYAVSDQNNHNYFLKKKC